ncbi:MAG: glycoside hydrolase family 32 protein [Clostridia bacterium]|nr:glycoside hydrolase family 32 protein [Clostridia bacterium]
MLKRLEYHFEPKTGWMNDPNGLVYFNGQYHAFFQHYPYRPVWGQMHWGHATSDDLISWQEMPIALFPDQEYEDEGGCFSGSAIVKDDCLYLFYTSVSKRLGQTQSVAMTRDGKTFEKYSGNPVIRSYPDDGSADFRDPKVIPYKDEYRMVVGSGKDGEGRVLLYRSTDLLHWSYMGVLFRDASLTTVMECPDFFPLGDEYVLMFSKMGLIERSTQFVAGAFDGERFIERTRFEVEIGPDFYAPQTFLAKDGRRIIIGWLYNWKRELDEGASYAGALSLPRELTMENGRLYTRPVKEAYPLLKPSDISVRISGTKVIVSGKYEFDTFSPIRSVSILKDTKTVEVFVNGGECAVSKWF